MPKTIYSHFIMAIKHIVKYLPPQNATMSVDLPLLNFLRLDMIANNLAMCC